MNAEKPKARQPGDVQRHGKLSEAFKLRKSRIKRCRGPQTFTNAMSMKKIKIWIGDVGEVRGEIQLQGYEVAKLIPEVMRSKKTIRSYHV